MRVIRSLEPITALRGISPIRRAFLKQRAAGDIRSPVETVRRAFNVATLAAWQKKLETAQAESMPRELVHNPDACDPTEFFRVS